MEKLIEKWDAILESVRNEEQIGILSFLTWLEPLIPGSVDQDTNTMEIIWPGDPIGAEYISSKFIGPLVKATHIHTGVKYDLIIIAKGESDIMADAEKAYFSKNSFEQFIVDPNNENAFIVARQFAASLNAKGGAGSLLIHGDRGTGKSRLIHAINVSLKTNKSYHNSIFATGDEFLSHFIGALVTQMQTGDSAHLNDIRKKYCSADIFLIDGLDILNDKDTVKLELVKVLTEFFENKKSVVITSTFDPEALQDIYPELSTYFRDISAVRMDPPGYETRLRILQQINGTSKKHIENEKLEALAQDTSKNLFDMTWEFDSYKMFERY